MPEARPAADVFDLADPPKALRQLGSRAHQLHAAVRAADRFLARDVPEDRNTGSWLMSTALALATDIADDVDALARAVSEKPGDAALRQTVSLLRVRAHQLHAATRASDHFLDQTARDDQETGTWLVATALAQAHKLASDLDDRTVPVRRSPEAAAETVARRPATPLRSGAGS